MSQVAPHGAFIPELHKPDQRFNPEQHFLGLVRRAASARTSSHICFDALGEVIIDPLTQRYVAHVKDMPRLCSTPADLFRVAPYHGQISVHMPNHRDLGELLWIAAYHASAGRLMEGCSKFDVIQLNYWPNLSRLPSTPNIMRLCALLSRRAHSINLARKLLDVSEAEAYSFYCAALSSGALKLVCKASPNPAEEVVQEAPTFTATLSYLWHRLIGQ